MLQPYSPWPVAEKPVSQDRMREILAARTNRPMGNDARSAGLNQQPDAVSRDSLERQAQPLEWGKPQWTNTEKTSAYVQSACGKYSIDRVPAGVYTAWKRLPDTLRDGKPYKEMPIHLGCKSTKAEAEALCETDAKSG